MAFRHRLAGIATSTPTRLLAWLALLGATGLLVRGEVVRREQPEGVRVSADLVYRVVNGRKARLDVYEPWGIAPGGGRPAVVAVHGGGWRGGSKADYGASLVELARNGLVVVAIDYRLARSGTAAWPENADDVRAAVRWVHEHAADFRIDPDRVALMGASAGAHLALVAALDPEGMSANVTRGRLPRSISSRGLNKIRAVIDFYGPSDLDALLAASPATAMPIEFLVGGPPAGRRELPSASPVRLVTPAAPPVLILHGTDDALVPLSQSLSLADALKRSGVPHRLLVIEGARHGFGLKAGSRDLTPDLLAFLGSAWKD
jgi:acetyl esterase/lipase